MKRLLQKLLELPAVAKTRRVHALEHGTITLLSRRVKGLQVAGRSTPNGFWVYGDIETEDLRQAATDALARLQAGEAGLAIHPNCGTNLAVAGVLAGLSSFAASTSLDRREHPLNKVPRVVLAATASMLVSRPLGLWMQEKVTTSPDLAGHQLGEIKRQQRGRLTIHFVEVT